MIRGGKIFRDTRTFEMPTELAFQLLKSQNDFIIASRLAHWNVSGFNFPQYHALFEKIYNVASEKVDTTVELLRALGYTPDFGAFSGPGGSMTTHNPADLVDMLFPLLNQYFTILSLFRNEIKEDPLYAGLVNLQEELMQDCTQLMYLLSSCK